MDKKEKKDNVAEQKSNIYKKLLNCQKEFEVVIKDNVNPFYKSKYADINSFLKEIKPVLNKNGLLILQPIVGEKIFTDIYDCETGEKISSEITLPEPHKEIEVREFVNKFGEKITTTKSMVDPQKQGASITYFRRFALQSFLCLQAEDDDGNTASGKKETDIEQKNQENHLNRFIPEEEPEMTKPQQNKIIATMTNLGYSNEEISNSLTNIKTKKEASLFIENLVKEEKKIKEEK